RFKANQGTDSNAPLPNIKLPVLMNGLIGTLDRTGGTIKVTSGTATFSAADVAEALVGKGLATKNNLKVGSTFTAYSSTFKVVGIFDAGNEFGNDGLYVPLATAERLTNQPGEVSQIFVKANSIDNLDSVKTAVGNALGNTRVDISSANQSTVDALAALASIQSIAFTGMIVALAAAAVITFLIMVMIVRERRREIGVLKAIGGSNTGIVSQFVTEALVLTLCGALIGIILATLSSGAITGALVNANAPQATSSTGPDGGAGVTAGGGPSRGFSSFRIGGRNGQTAAQLVSNIKTNVGAPILGEGLLAAVLIAVLGSAIPAFLIAKIRPSEVLRGE
ncbi:MAG TPA: FtsX-like permease family protein, partial [Candidatus Saccharimonadia bacterium]|nr:FtsX-like permease family protein [Candidatus Saccharimonadia bacterium]